MTTAPATNSLNATRPYLLALAVGLVLVFGSCGVADQTGLDGLVMRHIDSWSGDGEDAEIRGLLQIAGECLYVSLPEGGARYPVVWPHGTSWDAENQRVIMASGESVSAGDTVLGGGGYRDANDIDQWAGAEAAALAGRCVDNADREVAVVNNSISGIGPVE